MARATVVDASTIQKELTIGAGNGVSGNSSTSDASSMSIVGVAVETPSKHAHTLIEEEPVVTDSLADTSRAKGFTVVALIRGYTSVRSCIDCEATDTLCASVDIS